MEMKNKEENKRMRNASNPQSEEEPLINEKPPLALLQKQHQRQLASASDSESDSDYEVLSCSTLFISLENFLWQNIS